MGATEVCNMALARFGAKRINDYDDASDTKPEALYCRLFYEPTAKALMRSHTWWFAMKQAQLSQDTTTPTFQWAYAYHLPNDFLRAVLVTDGSDLVDGRTHGTYELMGSKLYTDDDTIYLKYIRWVSTVSDWEPLFVDVMSLALARKLVIPLSQDLKLKKDIDDDLIPLLRTVKAMDRNEQLRMGREDLKTWVDAQYSDIP